jgi:hypothetical protein
MAKAFTEECSRESEIHETFMRILAEADPGYVNSVILGQFEQGLVDEVHFLLPGDAEDMQHVEQYIRAHGADLYQNALTSTAQRRATTAL